VGQQRDRALRLYDVTAARTSAGVLAAYSTSFGLGTRLLGRRSQQDIRAVYALVRLADEVVDTYRGADAGDELDELEAQTHRALRTGYSTNLVVHAFARTARRVGITEAETVPFFASMRADLHETVHDEASFADYVFGSAEVVGLMCLQVFLAGHRRTPAELVTLETGARALGAAFQKVNFLRDLAADHDKLGRSYFPGVDVARLTDDEKIRLLDDIDSDLAQAAATLPLLPRDSRRAVTLAHGLFAELSRRIRRTPASTLVTTRVRVPDPVKLRVALAATVGGRP